MSTVCYRELKKKYLQSRDVKIKRENDSQIYIDDVNF